MECARAKQAHPCRTRSVGALVDVNAYGCDAEQAISAVNSKDRWR